MKRTLPFFAAAIALCTASIAFAWDAPTHRTITLLGIDRLHERSGTPIWFGEGDIQAQIADGATTPDRYRSIKTVQLTHMNYPDHYLDIENLEPYGIKFFDISPLRNEYIVQLAFAKAKAGDAFKGRPVNPAMDPAKTAEWPGFLPYAILEHYGKLRSAFLTYRTIERINEPRRADQLKMARMQICVEMGLLSHFVGDAAQPLHTTKHHHGWVDENPEGYTTDKGFHSYVDGALPKLHNLTAERLRENMPVPYDINQMDPWTDVLNYIWRSHELVPELYRMKKTGDLEGLQGARLIAERVMDAGSMLGGLYVAAWESSVPTDQEVADFAKYDGIPALEAAPAKAAPADPAPAPTPQTPPSAVPSK